MLPRTSQLIAILILTAMLFIAGVSASSHKHKNGSKTKRPHHTAAGMVRRNSGKSSKQKSPPRFEPVQAKDREEGIEDVKGREDWFLFQRKYPFDAIPDDARKRAFDVSPARSSALEAAWQPIGPMPTTSAFPNNWGITSGRINTIAISPVNTQIVLIGGATGGIWRSTNGGTTFAPTSDNQTDLAVQSIAFSQSSPNIAYAGMGDSEIGYLGTGVLKSTDSGQSWTRVNNSSLPSPGLTTKLEIDPTNANRVYLAQYAALGGGGVIFSSGFFLSTDGGVSWTNTLPGLPRDLVLNPSTPQTLYLAMARVDDGVGLPGLYRSTNGGSTWTRIYTTPYDLGTTSDVAVAVTPANPQVIYVYTGGSINSVFETRVEISTNGGTSWTNRGSGTLDRAQFGYNTYIYVDPSNANTVYAGTRDVFKSVNGAVSWTNLTNNFNTSGGYNPQLSNTHPDQHAFTFLPGSPSTFYIGNDGGIWKTTNAGTTFSTLNSSLSLTMFVGYALHPTNTTISYGGTQDNGSQKRVAAPGQWREIISGDGGNCVINPTNPSMVFTTYIFGTIFRLTNNGDTFDATVGSNAIFGEPDEGPRIAFYPPFVGNNVNSTLYFGTWRLFTSTNLGNTWTAPAGTFDLTIGLGDVLSAIAVSRSNTNVIYTGSAEGRAMVSTNGGASWTDISAGLPNRFITSITVDPTNSAKAYLTFSGFSTSHVFVTTNSGATWTSNSGNLPDIPVNTLLIDPLNPNTLYIGTDIGVFQSTTGGNVWAGFNSGLAPVIVNKLVSQPGGLIQAASYGRGAYELNQSASTVQVMVQTNPPGLSFAVDGTGFSTLQTFSWTSGSSHTISTSSPQGQYLWGNWSDGGAISHSVAPVTNTTYTANFTQSPPTLPGDLDSTFDGDGKAVTPFGSGHDHIAALALQADGKLVAAGFNDTGTNFDFALARYNSNGALDGTFGAGGKVTTSVGAGNEEAAAVAIQPDGKIVAAGFTDTGTSWIFALTRYDSNGNLDPSFGSGGKVTTTFFGLLDDEVHSIAIQPDGRIVVVGSTFNGTNNLFALARYDTNGSIDATFGSGGRVTTAIGTDDIAFAVAIQTDGKIVTAGQTNNGANDDFALARYNANGTLDTSFGSGGKVTTAIGTSNEEAYAVLLQTDGKIVVAGTVTNSTDDFALVRYKTDGALDTTFGGGGKVTTAIGSSIDRAFAAALQVNSKIVVAGFAYNGTNTDFGLARYGNTGTLDATFGSGGKVITPIGNYDENVLALAIQGDGRIVAAGSTNNGADEDFALVRYLGDSVAPSLQFSAANYVVDERSSSVYIKVNRLGNTGSAASVSYSTTNGTATAGSDYTATSGTLNFAAGDAFKYIPIAITNDAIAEFNETFNITLSNASGTPLGSPTIATITILDDELSITVTNTSDGGPGSLRQAITDANTTTPAETIVFNIPGSGPFTITPTSVLPPITNPGVIDGTTQPGFAGTPIIELNGTSAGAGASGLTITAANCSVKGLVINRFGGSGILLSGAGATGNQIQGNYIGTNVSGAAALPNTGEGIKLLGASSNIIGGAGAGNVISGNSAYGIFIVNNANLNQVKGNLIGTNANCTGALGNGADGVIIQDSANNTVGGTTLAERNVISGNQLGVRLIFSNAISNLIAGNFIGTNLTRTVALGNITHGVVVTGGASSNAIRDNYAIANNGGNGITVLSGTENLVLRNSIFSNTGLGIDLNGDGVTGNDSGDGDSGPNNLQNYPVLTSAVSTGTSITIQGTLNSTINSPLLLNFFASPSCDGTGNGEGKTYLGALQVTTDGSGNATINTTFSASITAGQVITATAMTSSGSSSEFSSCLPVTGCSISLDRDHQSFAGNGGTGTVNITASGGCGWTATTSSAFITITSGNSGTGNGAVQYSVLANTGSTIRSDTITIAGQSVTIYQGINFSDVPSDNVFYTEIGKLAARGVTLGCGNGNYCPNDPVTREQMAAFIMRAKGEFNPPTPGSQRFTDVPPQNVFYNFIDRLAALQITLGCTPDHLQYCPGDPVKREQMAAFLLRGLGEFNPPAPATQRFTDVPPQNVFYNFIDRLAVLQITLGCTPDHLQYCPGDSVTRAQMAAFLVRAFNL